MKRNLKINNLHFRDFPRERYVEAYHQATTRFVDYFQNHPAVKAIYGMGGINDPGISDLDLILVLKDDGTLTHNDYQFLDSLDSYIFSHRPFVISEKIFPYLPYLFFASDLSRLGGAEYEFFTPESDLEKRQLAWILCAEAAIGQLFDLVYQITFRKKISLRNSLLKLNSIKHNIKLAEQVGDGMDGERFEEFTKEITLLRENWFPFRPEEKLIQTCIIFLKTIGVLSEIIDHLCSVYLSLLKQPAETAGDGGECYFLLPNCLQIAKFIRGKNTEIKTLMNPLFFLRSIGGPYGEKIVRHINDISIITLSDCFVNLFQPMIDRTSVTARILSDGLVRRGRDKANKFIGNSGSQLFRQRHILLDEYHGFIRESQLSGMSVLVIGPWYRGIMGRFFGFKQRVLKDIIKIGFV